MELSMVVAIIGCALSVAGFFINRMLASESEGKVAGSLATDVEYIKKSLGRIEERLEKDVGRLDNSINASVLRVEQQHDADVNRLDGRMDEISKQLATANTTAARACEIAKSAHKRQDEHLERDHGQTVVKHER